MLYTKLSKKKTAIIIHIHYLETILIIKDKIVNSVLKDSDIYISLTPTANERIDEVKKCFPRAEITSYENKGRDIRPFFMLLRDYEITKKYDFILKIHGKKTEALPGYGAFWFVDSLNKLIPTDNNKLEETIKLLSTSDVLGPAGQLFNYDEKNDKNNKEVMTIINRLGQKLPQNKKLFFGGSMLWFSTKYLKKLESSILLNDDFQDEKGQYDATFAHAIERIFTIAAQGGSKKIIHVVDFQKGFLRECLPIDISIDGLIREYEEFSGKAVLVSMSGSEYILDYNDLKEIQARRYEDKINSEQAIGGINQPDNVHTLLVKTQEELNRIKSSKKYRLLEKMSTVKAAVSPKRYKNK